MRSENFSSSGSTLTAAHPQSARGERRQHPRFKCEGTAHFCKNGADAGISGHISDISESGCYVEMQATSPPGTVVSMALEIEDFHVQARGSVQVCYPLLGMGIAFTAISPADHAELERLLRHLANRQAPAPTAGISTPSSAPTLLMVTDPGAALAAIAQFFAEHSTLTRSRFEELIRQSQEALHHR